MIDKLSKTAVKHHEFDQEKEAQAKLFHNLQREVSQISNRVDENQNQCSRLRVDLSTKLDHGQIAYFENLLKTLPTVEQVVTMTETVTGNVQDYND